MKNKDKNFVPLSHDNLDLKNELLNLARGLSGTQDNKLQNDLAAILIYSNMAEYLAENLLKNLTHFVKEGSYNYFGAILFLENMSNRDKMTLNQLVEIINKFSFPDKDGIVECFKKIGESRNKIFHNFAKTDIENLKNLIKNDFPIIKNNCENLIDKINTVYTGLNKILNSNLKKQNITNEEN